DIKTMDDLFAHTLRDIYAEKQIVQALPEMIDKAADPQLKRGFESHLGETKNQVTRLEQVFKLLGKEARAWIARPSTASSTRPKTSPARSRINPFSTPRSSLRRRRSSTTRSRAMAR